MCGFFQVSIFWPKMFQNVVESLIPEEEPEPSIYGWNAPPKIVVIVSVSRVGWNGALLQEWQLNVKFYFSSNKTSQNEIFLQFSDFQHNRDLIKSTIVPKIPRSFANVVGRPSFVIFCVPQESYRKTFVDLNVLIEKAGEIFEKGPENPYIGSTQLKKLAAASNFTMDWNRRSFEPLSHGEMSYFWEFYFLRTAKWLTYFEEFKKIPRDLMASFSIFKAKKLEFLSSFFPTL